MGRNMSASVQLVVPRRSDSNPAELPRERLLRGGPGGLSDSELLAVLLGSGLAGLPVGELSRSLLDEVEGLRGLAELGMAELASLYGVGPARAARLLASVEIGRRLSRSVSGSRTSVRTGRDVADIFQARLAPLLVEQFHVLILDARNRPIREHLIAQGSLTSALVHPREVFRPAIRAAAASVVVVHNHPSGDPEPSEGDRRLTSRLDQAGRVVGIPLVDHVVVASAGYVSFIERGLLEPVALRRRGASRS